jgi:Domain of unknown function (DUF4124)
MQIRNTLALLFALVGMLALIQPLFAVTYKWVDDKGVTHYGDQIPLEYQNKGRSELNKRGIVVNKTGPEMTEAQKKEQEEVAAKKIVDEQKAKEQQRQDAALLNTYTSPEEIDAKRDRDVQYIKLTIENTKSSLASADEEFKAQKKRADEFTKNKKPIPQSVKEDIAKATAEKQRLEHLVQLQLKQLDETNAKYTEYRKRFIELSAMQPKKPSAAR